VLNRLLHIVPAVCLLTAVAGGAPRRTFIGDWKLDETRSRLPDQMKVHSKGGNQYGFDFGGSVETITVDGSDQPGAGGTTLSVRADTPHTWVVQRKRDGRVLLSATWRLSQDGRTLTDDYREFEDDGSTLSMEYVYERAGGGSGFAADWESIKETVRSPFFIQVKEFDRDGLSFVYPLEHRTKHLKFNGEDYPNEGPQVSHGASSSGQHVNARTLVITDKSDGKVTATERVVLSDDLQTLTITQHVTGRAKPNVLVFRRSAT